MTPTLKGQVAWITGGGSGIGLAGAIELVKAGAHVVISGRNAATNASALTTLQALGSAEAILLDVADKHAVKAAAQDIVARHGRIDILVTSAGTNATQRNFDVVTPEAWDDVVAINLSGLFYCVHAVLPTMRQQQGGLIINVSSWAGLYASKLTGPAYNATKRAVLARPNPSTWKSAPTASGPARCCPAKWPPRFWTNAPCHHRKHSAISWCKPKTWGRPFCFWRKCPPAPASTNS